MNVRIKGLKEGTYTFVSLPMLDPQDALNYLYGTVGLECPMEQRKRYWESLRSTGLLDPDVTDEHVPVSIYGDDVQVNKQGDSIFGLYISFSRFKPRKVRAMHYPIFSIRSHLVDGVHTLWPILRRVTCKFECCILSARGSICSS